MTAETRRWVQEKAKEQKDRSTTRPRVGPEGAAYRTDK